MTKEMFELLRSPAVSLPPLAKFALGMVLVFSIPPLARRVRLPGVVGLLLSGVMIGPHGDLIRRMNSANPLWGAPRIHGELLKLGIKVSQATVAKYMVRRVGRPSPTWRSFLRNQGAGIAAIDMFVVVSASFQLLYVMIILAHDRRRIVRFDVTEHPAAIWLSQQVTEAYPWDTAPRYLLRDRDASYGTNFRRRVEAMGIVEVITAPR